MKNTNLSLAAWDMRLYLNTHPNDQYAMAMYHKYCSQNKESNYARLPYHLFTTEDGRCCPLRWMWIDSPWPWELNESREV